jgi:VWFA-related protein
VVLVLDNVRTPPEIAHRVRDVANKFADRASPSDTMGVVTLAGGRAFTTSSPAQVRAAIKGFTPAFGESIATPAQEAASGLQAIAELSAQLARSPHRRKVLVFIGSAGVFSPNEPSAFDDRGPDMSARWLDAIHATTTNSVSVYAIDPAGSFGRADGYTENFAGETGGAAWVGVNSFNTAVERIWRESGSYYLLGYQAPLDKQRRHEIEVRVAVPGLTVRARRGRS